MAKREKSKKYAGVYFRIIDAATKERMYYIVYRQGGRGSKLIEEPVGKSSMNMTEAKAATMRADRMRGKALSNVGQREHEKQERKAQTQSMSIGDIWAAYEKQNSDKKLIREARSYFHNHLKAIEHMKPMDFTTEGINTLRDKLLKTPSTRIKDGKPTTLSPQTVKHILALLQRLIAFAVDSLGCPPPQSAKFNMPKVSNEKTEMLTDAELERLILALDAEPDQTAVAPIRLALVTGMRRGALLGLKWADCDFDRGFIILRSEEAKNGKTSAIPMGETAKAILMSIPRKDSEYVFSGRGGGKRADFKRVAERIKRNAGLPQDFRPFHGLRHNYASRLASTGKVSLYVLQKLLTHSSPQMTQRYAHIVDATLLDATNLIDGTLKKK